MTKEEWGKVEEALKRQWQRVVLMCDGYKVSLSLERIDKMKLGIMVYVNGWLRGEWFLQGFSEEAKRFFPSRYLSVFSAKQKKIYSRYPFGKKYCKEHNIDLNKKLEKKGLYWKSTAALKRHFVKHNNEITLIEA